MRCAPLAVLLIAGCGSRARAPDAGLDLADAGVPDAAPDAARWAPSCGPDADGDTISDENEVFPTVRPDGREPPDFDQDGEPNRLDLDSDADGVLDRDEAGDDDLCTPPAKCEQPESLCPMLPDAYLDADRDDDGVQDGAELSLGLDACAQDSDRDECPDVAVAELGACPADDGDLFLSIVCDATFTALVAHVVPANLDGARDWVELRIEELAGFSWTPEPASVELRAAAAQPVGSASPDGRVFRDATPGARLVFEVTVTGARDITHCGWRTDWAALRMISDRGERLTDRRIALTSELCTFVGP